MNRTYASVITLAIATFAAGHALAADPVGKTRAQVEAELLDAQRSGDIIQGESSQKLNELFPGRYAAKPVVQSRSRADVEAELAEARRTGDYVEGESSEKVAERFPSRYPAKPVAQSRTRAEVTAEVLQARRNGTLPTAGAVL